MEWSLRWQWVEADCSAEIINGTGGWTNGERGEPASNSTVAHLIYTLLIYPHHPLLDILRELNKSNSI